MYSIFTVCTNNYQDANKFTCRSWVATRAAKIFIYTDNPSFPRYSSKVEIVPYFSRNDDWLVNVGRKVIAAQDMVKRSPTDNMVFLDSDIFLCGEIAEVFDKSFDIAGSSHPTKIRNINAGVIFLRRNISLLKEWKKRQDKYLRRGRGVKYYKSAYEQEALSDLIGSWLKSHKYKFLDLPHKIWNLRVGAEMNANDIKEATDLVLKGNNKILHFYNKSFSVRRYRRIAKSIIRKLGSVNEN